MGICSLGVKMNNKIYVGNLSYTVTNDILMDYFSEYGTVESAKVIVDRDTNRSKGFAFVEMSSGEEASAAINGLNGKEIEGRAVNLSEAKPQAPRESRGGFGGSGNGGGFNRGGGRPRY